MYKVASNCGDDAVRISRGTSPLMTKVFLRFQESPKERLQMSLEIGHDYIFTCSFLFFSSFFVRTAKTVTVVASYNVITVRILCTAIPVYTHKEYVSLHLCYTK
jgi:hypothetical protein